MSEPQQAETPAEEPRPPTVEATATGPRASVLAIPALMAAVAVLLLVGGVLVPVPNASGFLGPRFFPLTIGTILLVTALASAAWALRTRRGREAGAPGDGDAPTSGSGATASPTPHTRGDWRTLGILAATLVAHVVLLEPLGWLIAGTLLFWGVSLALDHRRPLFDLCVAVTLASVVQLVFPALLDVSLPVGVLGKVL